MKKLFLFIAILFLAHFSQSQSKAYNGLGIHFSKHPESAGLGFSFFVSNLYFDFSSNFVTGKGEYLEFSSSQSYSTGKTNVTVFNIGYIIPVKNFFVLPQLGFGKSKEIFEDPIAFMSYFYGKPDTQFSYGVSIGSTSKDGMGWYLGIGRYEKFKLGILYNIAM